jgi:hypothetical protein
MPEQPKTPPERKVSITLTIYVANIDQSLAHVLEEAIRNAAEEHGANVNASYGNPIG